MTDEILKSLEAMSYGIYVLTAAYKDKYNGMIASWVAQVSYEPPMVMVALHPKRYTHYLVEESGAFTLHVIDRGKIEYMKRFKGEDPAAKFDGLEWSKIKTGAPVLKDCIAYIECKVVEKFSPGNHTLFIGEVVNGGCGNEGMPLTTLDYDRVYTGRS